MLAAYRGVIRRSTDDLLCLFVQDLVAAGAQCFRAVEHQPGIVTGRVRIRCRGADPDRRIEQAVEEVLRR